jgi:hypothetical protein
MDDSQLSRRPRLLAAVVRKFAGSRLERQLLARAFDLAWRVSPASNSATDRDRVPVTLGRDSRSEKEGAA